MADRLISVGSEINPINLEHPTLAFLRSYWDVKRGARAMPSRNDIRPSELREHLGWVNMAEVLPGFVDFRFRLIGTLVTQYFLRDATGKTVTEAFAPGGDGAIKGVKAIFRKTARDKVVMRVFGDAGWIASGYEQFDSIYLPLSDDGENVNLVLNAFVFDRPRVLMAREIAKAHGGNIDAVPAAPARKTLPGAA
ncbi:MAG TPA: PAS domain-containing protein [Rhizomicrobium sp.]|nr:PAS domain-containing protein [Rhizomicrobium sp.]